MKRRFYETWEARCGPRATRAGWQGQLMMLWAFVGLLPLVLVVAGLTFGTKYSVLIVGFGLALFVVVFGVGQWRRESLMHRIACKELGIKEHTRVPNNEAAYTQWCGTHGLEAYPFAGGATPVITQSAVPQLPSPVKGKGLVSRYRDEKAKWKATWLPRIGPDAVRAMGWYLASVVTAFVPFFAACVVGIIGGATDRGLHDEQLPLVGLALIGFGVAFVLNRVAKRRLRRAVGVRRITMKRIPTNEGEYLAWCEKAGVAPNPFQGATVS